MHPSIANQPENTIDVALIEMGLSAGQIFSGTHGLDFTGTSTAIGDFNGDGKTDYLFGAPRATFNGRASAGVVYVVYGTSDADPPYSIDLLTFSSSAETGFRFGGAESDDMLGSSIACIGDITQDGKDDFAISAIGVLANRGAVYIIFGNNNVGSDFDMLSTFVPETNGFRIVGVRPNDYFGSSLSLLGDIDHDNKPDLVVGATGYAAEVSPGTNGGPGACFVVPGPLLLGEANTRFENINMTDYEDMYQEVIIKVFGPPPFRGVTGAGSHCAAVGDVNNDGIDDLAVGIPGVDGGYVFVLYGRAGFDLYSFPLE